MRSLLLSSISLGAMAAMVASPAFAPSDSGGGGNSNVVTIDLSGAINAVHAAEDIESKAEAFIFGIIGKLKGIATQPNPPDTTALQAQVAALATELQNKTDEFKSALATDSTSAGTDPVVGSLNPTSGAEAGGDSVVINGSNLTGALAVNFGGTAAASFTVVSDTEIDAVTPAGTGSATVTVQGPASLSNTTVSFSYTPAAPAAT